MAEQTSLRRLLVLCGPALEARGILDFFRQHFQVQITTELEDALEVMRAGQFDAVLAETTDFLPLERGIVTQQASVVLDTIGDGVCIVGPRGELVWANRQLREFPQTVLERLREVSAEAYEHFASVSHKEPSQGKRFSMIFEDGTYYEVICSPVRDRHGLLRQVASVVVDATNQRRGQMKLNAIERAGRELVRLDHDVLKDRDASQRLELLEERVIGCSREVLDYQHFALLLLDERSNRLEMIISEDIAEEAWNYELFASAEGNGICGYVAATGASYICPDVCGDPRYLKGLANARSSLTVPLRLHDRIIGVLNVESEKPAAFGEEDRRFAEIFANYVALALHILNLLIFERHDIHTQVSGSISAELAGPLNDIITDTTELMEDYIGHDELRKRLSAIIDLASMARQTIKQLQSASPTEVLGTSSSITDPDPILSGKRVLVADDEELIRQTIRNILTPLGCLVDMACNGTEAIDMISHQQYDLVISDIKMPGATGYEVFAAAKTKCSITAVILTTAFGYDPHHSVVRAGKEGLSALLPKPFKVRQLVDECRTAVLTAGQ